MTSRRTYEESSPAVHAMDLIGERWALLVVRELLYRPKRFNELRTALPRMSPNVLSQRLRDLTERQIVSQRLINPSRDIHSYELTPWGRQLESLLLTLARWGAQSSDFAWDGSTTPDGLVMNMQAFFDAEKAQDFPVNMILWLDSHEYAITIQDAVLHVSAEPLLRPDILVRTSTDTLAAMLSQFITPQQALLSNRALVAGDITKLERLITLFPLPIGKTDELMPSPQPLARGIVPNGAPIEAVIVAD